MLRVSYLVPRSAVASLGLATERGIQQVDIYVLQIYTLWVLLGGTSIFPHFGEVTGTWFQGETLLWTIKDTAIYVTGFSIYYFISCFKIYN